MICKSRPVAQPLHRVNRCNESTPPNRRANTVRLPLLPLILSTQFVAWCIFGVICHGWQILLYPMSWGIIVTAFLVLNYVDNRRRASLQDPVIEEPVQKTSAESTGGVVAPVSAPTTSSDAAVPVN